jgi:outer membrane protein
LNREEKMGLRSAGNRSRLGVRLRRAGKPGSRQSDCNLRCAQRTSPVSAWLHRHSILAMKWLTMLASLDIATPKRWMGLPRGSRRALRPARVHKMHLLRLQLEAGCTLARFITMLLVAPAHAAEAGLVAGSTDLGTEQGAWIMSLGGTVAYGPKYPGAERYGFLGSPSISFRRPEDRIEFGAPEDSLGYALLDTPQLKFGPVANLRSGRYAGMDHRRRGLDRDPWALEAGAFVDVWPVPDVLRTRVEVRHGLREHDGLAVGLSADWVSKVDRFTLSMGPRLGVMDAGLAQLQFGVSPVASARNGLFSPYQARGGVQFVGLGAALSYDWSDQWRTTVFDRFDRLVGDAARSPITRRLGAADQFTAGVGVTYSFRTNLPFVP